MVANEWQAALDMIEEHPEQSSEWQYGIELAPHETGDSPQLWKRLPIHSACVLRAPVGVVEALHLAYPIGVLMKDPITGALPLHLACRHSAPPDLVKGLVMVHPAGARVADDVGQLPLHQACLFGGSRLAFTYLLQAFPHAVLFKDDKSKTPVQYAKANPTLRKETVELLEMVHYILEKQSAFEGGCNFKGCLAHRQIQRVEGKGSIVSGFFEEEESVMGRSQPVEFEKKLASIGMELPKGELSASHICLEGSATSVIHFPDEAMSTADKELIIYRAMNNDEGDILPDNDSLHIGESDEESELSHLNTEGFQVATEEDLQPIDNLTSANESEENDGSIADEQVVKEAELTDEVKRTGTAQAAGCETSSSYDLPTSADQVTKEAEVADELGPSGPLQTGKVTVSFVSHDDDDLGTNKDVAEKRMSWQEAGLMSLLASRHEVVKPAESAEGPVRYLLESTQAETFPHEVITVKADIPNGWSMEKDKVGENEPDMLSSCNSSIASDLTIWHCNSSFQSSKKEQETLGSSEPFQVENEQYITFKSETI